MEKNHEDRIIDESEIELGTFHDCHIHGLRWSMENYSLKMEIGHILEWIQPSEETSRSYRFLVARAELQFYSVDGVLVQLDWKDSLMDVEIYSVEIVDTRTTPNGSIQKKYEIGLSNPIGFIELWSTGFIVRLLEVPVETKVQRLPDEEEEHIT